MTSLRLPTFEDDERYPTIWTRVSLLEPFTERFPGLTPALLFTPCCCTDALGNPSFDTPYV